jgi:hypothetical protein
MQMAVRALGWVTKILWVVVLAIIITIAYSATQVSVAFGEPTTAVTEQTITISLPISIRNAGLYDLTQLNVTTQITDQFGYALVQDSTLTQIIARGTNTTTTHATTLNITSILAQHSDLLFNDTTLAVFQYVSFNYANAIPLSASANQTMPWGAPLSNLTVKQVTFQLFNTTYSLANVQLHFENHNQYVPVSGTIRVEVYGSSRTLVGTGTSNIDAPPDTSYNGQIGVLIQNSDVSPTPTSYLTGEVHLFFETPVFSYGPVVMRYV